jgi:uncharacterized protein
MPTIEAARSWYPQSDPVHGFDHVMRVHHLAERLAIAEEADQEIVLAAALLHDVESDRSEHHQAAAEFAAEILQSEGWEDERIAAVQHCIRAHRFRDESERPQSLEAKVLYDADKLDAIGATGVARAIAFALGAGQPVYAPPSSRFLHSGEREPFEPHSAYHEYLFKLRKLKDHLFTPTARNLAEERHRILVTYFEALDAEMHDSSP